MTFRDRLTSVSVVRGSHGVDGDLPTVGSTGDSVAPHTGQEDTLTPCRQDFWEDGRPGRVPGTGRWDILAHVSRRSVGSDLRIEVVS